jgi:chromosome segregation protein
LEGAIKNCDNLSQELSLQVKSSKYEEEISKKRLSELAPAIEAIKQKLAQAQAALTPLQDSYNKQYELVRQNEQSLRAAQKEYEEASFNLMSFSQREAELAGKIALEESTLSHENNNLINIERTIQAQSAQSETLRKEIEDLTAAVAAKKSALDKMRKDQQDAEETRAALVLQKQTLNDKASQLNAKKSRP